MELETLEDIFDFLSDKYHCCGEHKSGRQSFKEIHQQSQLFFLCFFFSSAGQHKPHFQTEGTSWQTGDYPNILIIPIFRLSQYFRALSGISSRSSVGHQPPPGCRHEELGNVGMRLDMP